jgi:LEA14-like dessication related protein
MRSPRPFLLLTLALTLGACSAIGRSFFTPPTVQVEDVRLVGVGMTGGTIDVLLRVHNPNGFTLDAKRVNYAVLLDTIPFGTGAITERVTVPKNDSATVRIPITFGIPQIMAAGSRFLQSGSIPYRFTGDITVATPFGDVTRKFDERGNFRTSDLW